jgi:hypothetical protein
VFRDAEYTVFSAATLYANILLLTKKRKVSSFIFNWNLIPCLHYHTSLLKKLTTTTKCRAILFKLFVSAVQMNPILLPVGVRFIFQERKENIVTKRDNLTKLCQSKAAFNGLIPSLGMTTLNFNSVLCPLSRLKYKKRGRSSMSSGSH